MSKLNKKIEFKIAADGGSASGKTTGCELIAKRLKMKEWFLTILMVMANHLLKLLNYLNVLKLGMKSFKRG